MQTDFLNVMQILIQRNSIAIVNQFYWFHVYRNFIVSFLQNTFLKYIPCGQIEESSRF